ncbi:MAG: pentapeptide repeat-containing protein [Hyphomicrobiaceae bacterium]|nr:pentapeptide repeat-containing protein [Hyphomicrobiaceae bacterium]
MQRQPEAEASDPEASFDFQWHETAAQEVRGAVVHHARLHAAACVLVPLACLYALLLASRVGHLDILGDLAVTLPGLGVQISVAAALVLAAALAVCAQALGFQSEIRASERRAHFEHMIQMLAQDGYAGALRLRDLVEPPHANAHGVIRASQQGLYWLALVGVPAGVLLLILALALPTQSGLVVWSIRAAALASFALCLARRYALLRTAKLGRVQVQARLAASATASALAGLVAVAIFTYPGEALDDLLRSSQTTASGATVARPFLPTDLLFGVWDRDGNPSRRPWLRRSLALQNADLAALPRPFVGRLTLTGRRLREANLQRAVLKEADLTGADLSRAILDEADLGGAILSQARLAETSLQGTRLTGARVIGTEFSGSQLRGTQFQGALLVCDRATVCGLANAKIENITGLAENILPALREALVRGARKETRDAQVLTSPEAEAKR